MISLPSLCQSEYGSKRICSNYCIHINTLRVSEPMLNLCSDPSFGNSCTICSDIVNDAGSNWRKFSFRATHGRLLLSLYSLGFCARNPYAFEPSSLLFLFLLLLYWLRWLLCNLIRTISTLEHLRIWDGYKLCYIKRYGISTMSHYRSPILCLPSVASNSFWKSPFLYD